MMLIFTNNNLFIAHEGLKKKIRSEDNYINVLL